MTTIDSDSESQDSDDGRRFRFEATRKDDTSKLHGHNRRRSPLSKGSSYRSRSTERSVHTRRNYDKTKQDRDRDKRKSSKERESRDNKSNNKDSRYDSKLAVDSEKRCGDSKNSNHRESKDSVRNSSNSKDYKNSKESRSRESKNKDNKIRETKDQDLKNSRDRETKIGRDNEVKDNRDRDRGPKRSRDASHEKLSTAKHGHKSREKYKSRERSDVGREKGKQSDGEKSKEEQRNKKKIAKIETESKNLNRDTHSPSKILEQIGSDSESDLGALDPDVGPVMSLDTMEDCRELNLSDFDIISDTEGSSSNSPEPKIPSKGPIIKGEILTPHYYGPKITKRVSRRQYERLVRRQAALNTRRLEELYKVNPRNDESTPLAPSNNNPSAVSDFLLGPEASSVSAVEERRRSQKREGEIIVDNIDDDNKDDVRRDKNQEELVNIKIYWPSLPPKCLKDYSLHPDADKVVEKQIVATQVGSTSTKILSKKRIAGETNNQTKRKNSDSISCADSNSRVKNESTNAVIGPTLPPGIRLNYELVSEERPLDDLSLSDKIADLGISAPIIGPSLPPHLKQENSNSSTSKLQDPLPPRRNVETSNASIFGPTLPPYLMSKANETTGDKSDSSDSEDGGLGPLPPDHPAAMDDYIQRQLEDRARRMRNKLDAKNSVIDKREEWMLELPSAQATNLGLGKRQFRSRAGPDMSDRSSWTDTPEDKAKKRHDKLIGKSKIADPAKESERLAIQQRDKAMEKMAEKHSSKKRKESLMEIHKKKLHKKKKKEEKEAKEAGKPTRRPFDRDIDLQANRFDEAQKKSILNKAQLLNDRFSRGESKYL